VYAYNDRIGSLHKFEDVLCDEPGLTGLMELEIDTWNATTIHQNAYNMPESVREQVRTEIEWLKSREYIRESRSPWASPIVTVKKPSGAIRLCVDYKRLNTVTDPAPFYMTTVEEALELITKAKIISTIDLNKDYYQVKGCERDIPKTAFMCRDGHFEFV